MWSFRKILLLINLKSAVVAALAIASTATCARFGIVADFPLALITIAVVVPIVFSIGGAYKRRDAALDDYGALKAHGRAIYLAARDWVEPPDRALAADAREMLGELLGACRRMFTEPISRMEANEKEVYHAFSDVSLFIRQLRGHGLASGELSRLNQYLSKMMVAFESVKHIYQYRTPVSLRAYTDVFIVLLPVVYGPYFATVRVDGHAFLTYVLPALFSLVLVSLDRIQAHLENPFDLVGEDDVDINAAKFAASLDDLTPAPVRRRHERAA